MSGSGDLPAHLTHEYEVWIKPLCEPDGSIYLPSYLYGTWNTKASIPKAIQDNPETYIIYSVDTKRERIRF